MASINAAGKKTKDKSARIIDYDLQLSLHSKQNQKPLIVSQGRNIGRAEIILTTMGNSLSYVICIQSVLFTFF